VFVPVSVINSLSTLEIQSVSLWTHDKIFFMFTYPNTDPFNAVVGYNVRDLVGIKIGKLVGSNVGGFFGWLDVWLDIWLDCWWEVWWSAVLSEGVGEGVGEDVGATCWYFS
jgi:hypothetical protein